MPSKYHVGMSVEAFLSVCTQKIPYGIVRTALVWGVIQKEPCVVCSRYALAHHHNYNTPLDVIWLCDQHHHDEHGRLKVGKNGIYALGNIGISPELQKVLCARDTSRREQPMAPNDTREEELDDFMDKWRREQQKLERLLYGGKKSQEELPEERDEATN